jgi:hypothetical protein
LLNIIQIFTCFINFYSDTLKLNVVPRSWLLNRMIHTNSQGLLEAICPAGLHARYTVERNVFVLGRKALGKKSLKFCRD